MKILFFIIIGFLKGEIIYENKEVKVLKEFCPILILKSAATDYKLVVDEEKILLFKENNLIFKYEKILDKKIKVKEKLCEGRYDILGRKLEKGFFKRNGIYFEKRKDREINKFFILK
jgi:hypothetical protein